MFKHYTKMYGEVEVKLHTFLTWAIPSPPLPSHGATAPTGPGTPHYQGFTIADAPQSVRFLWKDDQSDAKISAS